MTAQIKVEHAARLPSICKLVRLQVDSSNLGAGCHTLCQSITTPSFAHERTGLTLHCWSKIPQPIPVQLDTPKSASSKMRNSVGRDHACISLAQSTANDSVWWWTLKGMGERIWSPSIFHSSLTSTAAVRSPTSKSEILLSKRRSI